MSATSVPALELRGVSKTFPGQRAVKNVSLAVQRGRVHALVGENGSGKSTLIKILAGYHAPDPGGEVWISGVSVERDRAAAAYRLGLRCVHQNLGLVDEFDAVENLGLTCGSMRRFRLWIDSAGEEERTRRLLSRIGVDLDVRRPIGKCSAIERTGVAIARAIADLRPGHGAVLLDEPTAALPPTEVDRLFEIIAELKAQDIGVMYVSHRLDEIFEVADDVSVIRGGSIVETRLVDQYTPRELIHLVAGRPVERSVRRHRNTASDQVLEVRDLRGVELAGVSFTLHRGEILGVAGLLGSGRAELGYVLGGHDARSGGSISLSGRVAASRHGIVHVPSDRMREGAVAEFSVRENATLADLRPFRRASGLHRRKENAFTNDWIERLEVRPPDPDANFRTLSGGNQQKIVLAKWLGLQPTVLVADEPTAGVDVGARQKIYEILRERASAGLAVIVCSSDVKELVEIADRLLVLRGGVVTAELASTEISEPGAVAAMLGLSEPSDEPCGVSMQPGKERA